MIDFILRPIRRRFGKDRAFYAAIDDMFGFIPHNIELYKLALIHKSASVTLDDGSQVNNERLEFLGDAVIESVTSDYLFIEFPDRDEGFLTQLRSKMVSRQSLNEVAKRLSLDAHVITHSSANFSQKHIYGDAFEAMIGAIYLDQGYDFVNRLLINRIFVDYLKMGTLLESETDFKSRLIEWCQKNHHTIRFVTMHDRNYSSAHPVFYCKVLIDNIEAGYGAGDSKKEAEQHAAFSVSQGVRDEDCARLLEKLDRIDADAGRRSEGVPAAAGAAGAGASEGTNTEAAASERRSGRRRRRRGQRAAEADGDVSVEEGVSRGTEAAEGASADAAADGGRVGSAAVCDGVAAESETAGCEAAGNSAETSAEPSAEIAASAGNGGKGRARTGRRGGRRAESAVAAKEVVTAEDGADVAAAAETREEKVAAVEDGTGISVAEVARETDAEPASDTDPAAGAVQDMNSAVELASDTESAAGTESSAERESETEAQPAEPVADAASADVPSRKEVSPNGDSAGENTERAEPVAHRKVSERRARRPARRVAAVANGDASDAAAGDASKPVSVSAKAERAGAEAFAEGDAAASEVGANAPHAHDSRDRASSESSAPAETTDMPKAVPAETEVKRPQRRGGRRKAAESSAELPVSASRSEASAQAVSVADVRASASDGAEAAVEGQER